MVSCAGGLALRGMLPVVNTYAAFYRRAYEQVYVNATEQTKVIYAGHYAGNGKAFAAVKFLDGAYRWREDRRQATPADLHRQTDTSRILIHAGDVTTHASFEQFRRQVLSCPLTVTPDKVEYRFGPKATRLTATLFDVDRPAAYTLPTVNGTPIDLRPATTWQSPYLSGAFNGDTVTVSYGEGEWEYDFRNSTVTEKK